MIDDDFRPAVAVPIRLSLSPGQAPFMSFFAAAIFIDIRNAYIQTCMNKLNAILLQHHLIIIRRSRARKERILVVWES